jgi:DNA-binding transcriptional ArsR family regulator
MSINFKEASMSDNIQLPHQHHDCNLESKLIHNMPSDETAASVADAMKQLGDPSRLKIFWLLCHTEECVINVAAIVNMSSPAVSHHLKLLKAAGLLVTRRDGKEVYYKAADTTLVKELHQTIEKIANISCSEIL